MQLSDLANASVSEVAALPVAEHARLANEIAARNAATKHIAAIFDKALEQAYGKPNAPGTTHREADGFDVKLVTPKRVEWNNNALYDLADGNRDVADYVDWTPSVAESRYQAAPQRIRDQLDAARTVKLGKVKIEFIEKEG